LQQQSQWQHHPQRPQHPQQLLQQHWIQQRMTPPAAAATHGPPTFDDELMQQQQQPQKRPKKRVGRCCCHRYTERYLPFLTNPERKLDNTPPQAAIAFKTARRLYNMWSRSNHFLPMFRIKSFLPCCTSSACSRFYCSQSTPCCMI
jgi:hypothetical protein